MKKAILSAGFLAAATGLAGCDTIGDGVSPVEVMLVPGQTGAMQLNEDGQLELTECIPASVDAILRFSNGSAGLITNRSENVRYSSSNPSVVRISNLDVPVPGGQVFQRASLVPISPGTATIDVEYVGLRGSIEVVVEGLGPVSLDPDEAFTMAPNSTRQLNLRAALQGQTVSVSSAAHWSLDNIDEDAPPPVVIGSGSGLITAWQPGTATAVGELFVCSGFVDPENNGTTLPERKVQVDLEVQAPTSLDIVREFDDGHPLIIGTSEYLRAEAHFANGDTQDLTVFAAWTASEADVGTVLSAAAEGSRSIVITPRGREDEPNPGTASDITAAFTYCDFWDAEYVRCYDPRVPEQVPETPIEGVGPLTVFEATETLQVRPGLVEAIYFQRKDETGTPQTITTLEIPEGCAIQPDLIADLEVPSEGLSFSRRINRDAFFEIVKPEDENGDDGDTGTTDDGNGDGNGNGDGDGDGDGNGDAEPVDPTKVLRVVTNTTLPLDHNAGLIGAIGKSGQTASIRASIRVDPSTPDPAASGDDDETPPPPMRTAELEVTITDPADCGLID